jgi:uncharacterized membrane protein YoaK (UPF0700 family)
MSGTYDALSFVSMLVMLAGVACQSVLAWKGYKGASYSPRLLPVTLALLFAAAALQAVLFFVGHRWVNALGIITSLFAGAATAGMTPRGDAS